MLNAFFIGTKIAIQNSELSSCYLLMYINTWPASIASTIMLQIHFTKSIHDLARFRSLSMLEIDILMGNAGHGFVGCRRISTSSSSHHAIVAASAPLAARRTGSPANWNPEGTTHATAGEWLRVSLWKLEDSRMDWVAIFSRGSIDLFCTVVVYSRKMLGRRDQGASCMLDCTRVTWWHFAVEWCRWASLLI
jgi:hypothetical protein